MNPAPWTIRRLKHPNEAEIEQLASVLIDCVEGGASVHFMLPLTRDRALAFWQAIVRQVVAEERVLLVAEDAAGICGTVQLIVNLPENQPHRAEVAKMLVHRRARRRGVGESLMQAAEAAARELGKTLLILDTVTSGDGARLYSRLGWREVGSIPDFALMPQGGWCGATIYYRDLRGEPPAAAAPAG